MPVTPSGGQLSAVNLSIPTVGERCPSSASKRRLPNTPATRSPVSMLLRIVPKMKLPLTLVLITCPLRGIWPPGTILSQDLTGFFRLFAPVTPVSFREVAHPSQVVLPTAMPLAVFASRKSLRHRTLLLSSRGRRLLRSPLIRARWRRSRLRSVVLPPAINGSARTASPFVTHWQPIPQRSH